MKKTFTLFLVSCSCLLAINANAQDDISKLFTGSPSDVNKLTTAYGNPLFKGLGNGLNGGWANTAKTQKFLRFAIRVTASGSFVPNSDKTFDINQLGLSNNIKASNPANSISPTVGGSGAGQSITLFDPAHPNDPNYSYKTQLPDGETSVIPSPQIQLTIGVSHNTDLILRTIPTIKLSDDLGSVGMFGFGIKHNFAQDFSSATHPVPFDLALLFGYTRLSYTKTLEVNPDAGSTINGSTDFSNQRLEGHFSGINIQAIMSKKLLFFTPFVSVGYSHSSTDVGTLGNYPFNTGVTSTGKPVYTTYTDPIRVTDASTSGLHADVGFQLSLTFFKIYASYSASQYSSLNGGIGLGF